MVMLMLTLCVSISLSSCSEDEEGSNGGEASPTNIVGRYTAVTSPGYDYGAVFAEDGTGVIYKDYRKYEFTYSIAGKTGILRCDEDVYNIIFVEGFILLEDGDVELILYKEGRDLGKPNNKKFLGTWMFADFDGTNPDSDYTLTINADGTGNNDGASFTYTTRNSYIVDIKSDKSYFCEDENGPAILLEGKLYRCWANGYVDDGIFVKKK